MTRRQFVSASSQPNLFAAARVSSALRPQITFITGSYGRSKNRDTCRNALLWALPMNFVPIKATFNVFLAIALPPAMK